MWWRTILLFTYVILGASGTLVFMDARDGAAWIQCIWSIVGVFLAILIPGWYAEIEEARAKKRKKALLRELVGGAMALMTTARQARGHFADTLDFQKTLKFDVWQQTKGALEAYPIIELETAEFAKSLVAFRAAFAKSVKIILDLLAPIDDPMNTDWERWSEGLAEIERLLDSQRHHVQILQS